MKRIASLLLFILCLGPPVWAQTQSPYLYTTFPTWTVSAASQTSPAMVLSGKNQVFNYASGTINAVGTSFTTGTISVLGSQDQGTTYQLLVIQSCGTSGGTGTTAVVTATGTTSACYWVNLAGMDHVEFQTTSATFTGTSLALTLRANPQVNTVGGGGGGGSGDTITSPNSTLTVGGTSSATTLDVANLVTFNNSGSGATSGATFNGSAARTISYNTIGASPAAVPCSGLPALTGDTTTSAGSCATSTVKVNGASVPTSAAFVGTNGSGQIIASTLSPMVNITSALTWSAGITVTGNQACLNQVEASVTASVIPGTYTNLIFIFSTRVIPLLTTMRASYYITMEIQTAPRFTGRLSTSQAPLRLLPAVTRRQCSTTGTDFQFALSQQPSGSLGCRFTFNQYAGSPTLSWTIGGVRNVIQEALFIICNWRFMEEHQRNHQHRADYQFQHIHSRKLFLSHSGAVNEANPPPLLHPRTVQRLAAWPNVVHAGSRLAAIADNYRDASGRRYMAHLRPTLCPLHDPCGGHGDYYYCGGLCRWQDGPSSRPCARRAEGV